MDFLKFMADHIVVLDGAMGTMIQGLHLTDADFGGADFRMLSDLLTFSRPTELKDIHLKYLRAGAHAVETNTFGASPLRLKEYGFTNLQIKNFSGWPEGEDIRGCSYETLAYLLNKSAAQIARLAVSEHRQDKNFDGRPLFVIGSIGPSNNVLSPTKANLKKTTYDHIIDNFYHQTLGLIDGFADLCLLETQQDQLELKAAIHGVQKAMAERGKRLPIMAQVTVDQFGKMQIFNTDIIAALTAVQGLGIATFGINCSIGPDLMTETVKRLAGFSPLPISVIPNAGLPVSEKGKTVFKLTPEEFSRHVARFVRDFGVNIVGGCCGTTPAHIAAVATAVKRLKPQNREINLTPRISGPQKFFFLNKNGFLIRIGERLNVRGSKKVRDAVEGEGKIDFETLEEVASEQVKDLGLDIIDVCMDSNVVNTDEILVAVIQHITTDFSGALCLDSFSVSALLKALEVYPGRPIINSISLEEYEKGVDKIDALVGKTFQYDPIYIALCTSPAGPAQTAQEKFTIAKKIFEKCFTKYGIRADQLIVDVNAFPIGSESDPKINFALESLNAIPLIKSIHKDIRVSIGVGNLTNGLAKKPYMRKLLTSVFMHFAREKGMDAAIINPDHFVPVESLDQTDVALARLVILQRDMDAFSQLEDIAEEKKGKVVTKRLTYDDLALEEAICQKIKDGFKQRQEGCVRDGDFSYNYEDSIVPQVAAALKQHAPLDFINRHLMRAMKELGDGFAQGDVSLPHLLKSADVMKRAMGYIEALMKSKAGVDVHEQISYKGVVVLGTVYQDVHSIGKDLVKTLLENYGYRVIDLGVQTPLERFIETAKEHKATAIGMSALLVQTSNHMITVAKMVKEQGIDVHVLIGGAPVNWRHAAYVSMHGQENLADIIPNVFYCPSGMDGVNVMNQLVEPEGRGKLIKENEVKLKWHYEQASAQAAQSSELLKTLPRRKIDCSHIKRNSSQYCPVSKLQFTMADFVSRIDLKTLFSLNWRYGGKSSWEKKGMSEEKLKNELAQWVKNCDQNQWLNPMSVFAIFPCVANSDSLIIFDPNDAQKEIARFDFSVVIGAGKKDIFSATQYFLSEGRDCLGLQLSTGGSHVDRQVLTFKDDGDTHSALMLQGLSDRVAEDMAEYTHRLLRRKMGIGEKDGTRYSPGYPGLKDLGVNKIIAELLQAEKILSVTLTSAHEFSPTGTTAAVVCFHPEARYD